MKKKLLLTLVMVALLTCAFVVSVSADEISYDDAPAKTKIQVKADDIVVFDDGFSCPSAYVTADTDTLGSRGAWFDFSYINQKFSKNYGYSNVVEYDVPQGVKTINSSMFHGNTVIRRVSFPDSVESIGQCTFERATALEQCTFEHNENSKLDTMSSWMFAYCTSLQAISFPDCMKYTSGNNQLGGCTNLTAIYLSKNMEDLLGGSNTNAVFGGCTNAYFVSEPFTYDNIPPKPQVYFFPETLEKISGETFDSCKNLNEVLVFGSNMVTVDNNGYTFEVCESGNGKKPTVVFLGDMSSVAVGGWNVEAIYFSNVNDVDAGTAGVSGSKTIYYCNGANNTNHLVNPKETKKTDATCTTNEISTTYCFCGKELGTSEVENSALGHDYDLENGATLENIEYTDYLANGCKVIKCSRCDSLDRSVKANVLYTFKGYSAKINGSSVTLTYLVDKDALAEYKTFNADFKYGVVAYAPKNEEDVSPINQDGTLLNADRTIYSEIGAGEYVGFDFILNGFALENYDVELIMCAFVNDGKNVYYLGSNGQGTSGEIITFNSEIIEKGE